jgi:CDP-glucose 4,6-dehydratase
VDDHLTSRLNHWYSARKVFVTGHTGFKGAWLVAWLRAAGAVVTGYALPAPPGRRNLFELAGLESGITSHLADICDRDALEGALRQSDADVVFHLAAQSLVRQSYLDPVETYRTNVLGTAQLLDVVRRAPSVRAVVIVTSDKCYENDNTSHRYTEADAMGGHDPYSSSKGCAELVTAAFRSSFFAGEPTSPPRTGIASARAGNVIGPGDWAPHRIMPDLMTAAENGTQAFVRNPTAVRPWQFVLEPLRGYLMLGSALANGGAEFASAWNFGPADEDAISVARLADGVRGTLGKLEVVHEKQDPAPHEAHVLRLDSSKAEQRLGWRPVLSLPRAIEISVRGYQQIHRAPSEASATMTSILEAYWSDVDAAT